MLICTVTLRTHLSLKPTPYNLSGITKSPYLHVSVHTMAHSQHCIVQQRHLTVQSSSSSSGLGCLSESLPGTHTPSSRSGSPFSFLRSLRSLPEKFSSSSWTVCSGSEGLLSSCRHGLIIHVIIIIDFYSHKPNTGHEKSKEKLQKITLLQYMATGKSYYTSQT